MQVVLITGCSSGFGYLTALKFARNGWRVIASVRSIDSRSKQLAAIFAAEKLPAEVVKLDVRNDTEVIGVIQSILQKYKKIDVLVNNAGFGLLGPIEAFSIEEIKQQYDVNILGLVRMTQAVLPSMRTRKSGRIINISSITGLIPFGIYGVYSSSKFAVEALSEALRFEVRLFGVDVTLLEPGSFSTHFKQHSRLAKAYTTATSPYQKLVDPSRAVTKPGSLLTHPLIERLRDPQRVADKIFQLATLKKTKTRYQIGVDAKLYVLARKVLPEWIWEAVLHTTFRW